MPDQYFTPPPFALIAGASVIMFVPRLRGRRRRRRGRAPPPPGLRPHRGTGLEAGPPSGGNGLESPRGRSASSSASGRGSWSSRTSRSALLLVSTFAGGFIAGILSPGGARAGFGSGLLAGVFGLGAIALYFIWQASTPGDGRWVVPEGLWPIALAIMAFWVLPAVALGGALGGSFRRPSGASPEPEL